MLLPPGAEGPEHTHHDVEEAFFVLEGQVRVGIHRGEDEAEYRTFGYRDMIVDPGRSGPFAEERGRHRRPVLRHHRHQKPQVPDLPRALADARRDP